MKASTTGSRCGESCKHYTPYGDRWPVAGYCTRAAEISPRTPEVIIEMGRVRFLERSCSLPKSMRTPKPRAPRARKENP